MTSGQVERRLPSSRSLKSSQQERRALHTGAPRPVALRKSCTRKRATRAIHASVTRLSPAVPRRNRNTRAVSDTPPPSGRPLPGKGRVWTEHSVDGAALSWPCERSSALPTNVQDREHDVGRAGVPASRPHASHLVFASRREFLVVSLRAHTRRCLPWTDQEQWTELAG